MMAYIYAILLAISIGVLVFMAARNYTNIDIYYWSIILIIPVIILGYMLKAQAEGPADAKVAFCFVYLDSTLLLLLTFLSMLKYLGIEIRIHFKMIAYAICIAHLVIFWACRNTSLYYATFTVERTPLGSVTRVTDGPLKFLHYVYIAIIVLSVIGVLIYCFTQKKDCSKKALVAYGFFDCASILTYVLEMVLGADFSLLPFWYIVADVFIASQYEMIHSHDISCVVMEQQNGDSRKGYAAFDNNLSLLCYNREAVEFVPELEGMRIDAPFGEADERLREVFYSLLDTFRESGRATKDFTRGDTLFRCTASVFYMHKGGRPEGYLVELQDVTAEQGYMNLIRQFGQSMEESVKTKTQHIRFIQQKVVLGMATIIENRDLNTGGHVKRTSDVIKIILDEMRKQGIGEIDDVFADEVIRSAPMHDLGKISIDNKILNKPGRLTDEEYKIMQSHSAKSGEIVLAILTGVEEPHFVQTAYCLARFHHERWDGKGYPERLAQYEIPLEARIMAVADVYDALVSKRCYKEPMSFEQAAQIMLEGMGTQFDPMMKPVFEGCREQLEQYYRELKEA